MPTEYTFRFRPMVKWPRAKTPTDQRKREPFSVTLEKTYRLLRSELVHLKVEGDVVIELAIEDAEIRNDGMPRASASPSFPGVTLAFKSAKLGPMQYSCDACHDWPSNLRAIGLTLERLRLIDAYGCTSRHEQYTGWRALPAPMVTPPPMTVDEAKQYISAESGLAAGGLRDRDSMNDAYRAAAKKLHPDATNGSRNGSWLKLQEAKAVLDRSYS